MAEELTGLEPGTLRDYSWIAGQYESSVRTDDLSWHHYRVVAALPAPQRDALLRRAAEGKTDKDNKRRPWSVADLR